MVGKDVLIVRCDDLLAYAMDRDCYTADAGHELLVIKSVTATAYQLQLARYLLAARQRMSGEGLIRRRTEYRPHVDRRHPGKKNLSGSKCVTVTKLGAKHPFRTNNYCCVLSSSKSE